MLFVGTIQKKIIKPVACLDVWGKKKEYQCKEGITCKKFWVREKGQHCIIYIQYMYIIKTHGWKNSSPEGGVAPSSIKVKVKGEGRKH